MRQQNTSWLFYLLLILFITTGNISAQTEYPEPELIISDEKGEKGDTVCVRFIVNKFIDVEAFTFQVSFNRNILEPISPVNYPDNNVPSTFPDIIAIYNFTNLGYIRFSYIGNDKASLPDGTVLFELCFRIVGNPGDISPIFLNTAFPDSGIVQPEFQEPGSRSVIVPLVTTSGSICVTASQLTITRSICDATNAPINNNGILEFYFGGGTQPYSYTVTPGPSGSGILPGQRIRLENLNMGTYTINVTDAMGTTRSLNVVISNNLPWTYTLTGKDPDCSNRDIPNGSAVITITDPGSNNPDAFRYEWSNFIFNTPANTNIQNGTYYVTIIDPNGCRVYDSTEIFRPRIDVDFEIIKDESCPGRGDGEVKLTVNGGAPFSPDKYNIRLDGLPFGLLGGMPVVSGVRGGDRFINVIDSLNCFETVEFFMPTKTGITVDTIFNIPVSCFDGNNGRISFRANEDGNTNFTFLLRFNNQIVVGGVASNNTYTNSNLPAGDYSLSITSVGSGCLRIITFRIEQPAALDLSNVNVINPSCSNNIGTITVVPSGGIGPYNFRWSHDNTATGNSVSGLPPGNYTLTVTDQNNCTATNSFILIFDGMGSAPVTNARVVRSVSCSGGNDGEVTVDVFPLNPLPTFTWRRINETNVISNQQNAANLSAGTYIVLVSNGNCNVLDTVELINPPGMDVTFNLVQPTCPGLSDGSIGAIVTGGNPNYNYQWFVQGSTTPISVNSVLAPTKAGSFDLVLIDSKNCRQDTFVTLTEPQKIDLQLLEVNQVNCFGFSNGRADVIATGGTTANPTFNYQWSTSPLDSGPLAFNLPAGRNWVVAFDNICVSDTVYFDVPTVSKIALTTETTFTNPSCYGLADGTITAVAGGGLDTGFRYRWLNVPNGNTSFIQNLPADIYFVRLTDTTGCTVLDSVRLTQPDSLSVTLNPLATQLLSCRNTDSGQIGVIAVGGNPGVISFRWNFKNESASVISGLSAGNYCVTATDIKGCTADYCYTLMSPPPVVGRVATPAEPPCFGQRTKLCIDFITGGTGNKYSFQINQGQRFPADSCATIFAGTYTINLIDSAGCFIDTVITINQPTPIEIELPADIEVLLGESSDLIIAQVNSGFGVDRITWTPADPEFIECVTPDCASVIFSPVSTTIFQVMVTDLNGCTAVDDIEIRVKDVRNVFFPNIFSPREEGARNGPNSFFNVSVGKGVLEIISFEIYDRWGNKVFSKYNYMPDGTFTDGWDGTFRGQLLNSAVFAYRAVVRFSDGKEIPYTGAVTLVR